MRSGFTVVFNEEEYIFVPEFLDRSVPFFYFNSSMGYLFSTKLKLKFKMILAILRLLFLS